MLHNELEGKYIKEDQPIVGLTKIGRGVKAKMKEWRRDARMRTNLTNNWNKE